MSELLAQMNRVLEDWCIQFDPLHCLSLSFTEGDRGEVYLGQQQVFLFPNLTLQEALYDIDTIRFTFDHNRFLEITISWPEDLPQQVDQIRWGYHNTTN